MSQIGSNIYPNTLFPDSVQTLPQFTDLTSEDESNYLSYLQAIINGDLANANYYLSLINPNCLVSATSLNTLSDTIGAVQDLYSSTTTFSDIVSVKQAEWQNIISKFSYVGEWKKPAEYKSNNTYAQFDLVIYDNAVWECQINGTINIVPQKGTYWTQYYVKNTMVGYTDSVTNRNALYIALQDIDTDDTPYESYISDDPKWFRLTLIGIVGDNGEGFSFRGEWNYTVSYSMGDLVTYDEVCYSSLTNNNLNHTPSIDSSYWKREFTTSMKQIPVQAEMPTDQDIGDLWFEVITI